MTRPFLLAVTRLPSGRRDGVDQTALPESYTDNWLPFEESSAKMWPLVVPMYNVPFLSNVGDA